MVALVEQWVMEWAVEWVLERVLERSAEVWEVEDETLEWLVRRASVWDEVLAGLLACRRQRYRRLAEIEYFRKF